MLCMFIQLKSGASSYFHCYLTAMFLSITLIFYAPFIMLSIFYLHFSLLNNYVIYVPICNLFKLYIITISCVY